jgi:DNA excision repair protein ERCC-4
MIWLFATAKTSNDLKLNNPESDPQAIAIGAEEVPDAGASVDAAAEELLRSLPGITAKNVKHITSKVRSVHEMDRGKPGESLLGRRTR